VTGDHGERAALTAYLQAQRCSVLAIVDGLAERDMRRPVVPTGWTPLGMIEHLAGAERFWFQRVVAGISDAHRGASPETGTETDNGPFATGRDVSEVITFYREQAARSSEILADAALDARPSGPIPADLTDQIRTVRDVALHLVEETARHAGHLDVARELLDGRTGLGPR
jgi:hypothetical protein